MRYLSGDFVLVNFPKFGASLGENGRIDYGPFIVRITSIEDCETFAHVAFSRIEENGCTLTRGTNRFSDIIAKIHERDVSALFKEASLSER